MTIKANSPEEYLEKVPEERKEALSKLRETILANLPEGFEETMLYNMVAYVVPLSAYPDGYHVNPSTALPFINFASQKNFIALYHMGIYANEDLMKWFVNEYPKHCKTKLDMGKSCIRFKKVDALPFELIGELISKMSMQEWIDIYEENIKVLKK
tara:strand:+ start:2301 stop:2765 length:465 start_codon:yes stop_codon:yes gene_type:complete